MRWYELLLKEALILAAFLTAFFLLRKLDPFLLKIANRLFRIVNWATGRDNFYFARWTIKIIQPIALLYAISSVYITSMTNRQGLGVRIALLALFVWLYAKYWPGLLAEWESLREQELLDGAKSKYLHDTLERERRIWVFFFIASFSHSFNFSEFCWKILVVINILTVYLLSLDHPPFSRSQIGEWLRGLLRKPEPVLITSEGATMETEL